MATVTLRIVGLFFNETFEMPISEITTVKDVVDEYIRQKPGTLSYIPQTDKPSPFSFTNNVKEKYNFDGLGGPAGDSGKSLGNKEIKPGTFTLAEAEYDTFELAWQYYVVSKRGTVKSKTPKTRKFTTWGATPPNYRIVEDDKIIWRLVAIANATEYHKP